jgi:hypothetical protein
MEMNFFKGFICLSLVTLLVLIGTYCYQKSGTSSAEMKAELKAGPAELDFEAEDSTIHELDASAAEEEAGQSGAAGTEDNTKASQKESSDTASAGNNGNNTDDRKAAASDNPDSNEDDAGNVAETGAASEGKAEEGKKTNSLAVNTDQETSDSKVGETFLSNYLGMTYDAVIKAAGKPDQQTEEDFVQKLYYNNVDIMGMTGRITVKLSNGKVRDASWYVNKGKASDYKSELKKLTDYLNDQYLQSDTYQWVVDSFQWVGLDGIDTNENLGIVFY